MGSEFYHCYTLEMLQNDLAARVELRRQQIVVSDFDMSSGGVRKLVDDKSLALAFFERQYDKRMFLFVDVKEKYMELVTNSVVTNDATAVAVASSIVAHIPHDGVELGNGQDVPYVIDWIIWK